MFRSNPTKCKTCAPFAILGSSASFEKMNDALKCQSGLPKKDPKNLGCVMHRNPPTTNDLNNRLLWTVENSDIIKTLSDELKRSFDDVAAFLYELNYSNFRKVLLQTNKHESRSCRIPLCEPELCDHYAEIFDDYGNLRQPKDKNDLLKLLCLMRSEFSEPQQQKQQQQQQEQSDLFSIIGLKRTKKSNGWDKDCFGLCDPLGCTQQRRQHFYNIDGKYSYKLSGDKMIGYDWSHYGRKARKVMQRAYVDKQRNCFSATENTDDLNYGKPSTQFDAWKNVVVEKNRLNNYESANGERVDCGVIGSYKDFLRNNILGKKYTSCSEKDQFKTNDAFNGRNMLASIEDMYNSNSNKSGTFDTRRLSPRGKELLEVLREVNKKTKLTNNVAEVIKAVQNVKFKNKTKPKQIESPQGTSLQRSNSSLYRKQLEKDGLAYYGEPVPVLFHKPFDKKKPSTWMRRHPNQERLNDSGWITNSRIRHYRRISEQERYKEAQKRMSVRSIFSRGSHTSLKSHAMFGSPISSEDTM